jgi:hypothetical protein
VVQKLGLVSGNRFRERGGEDLEMQDVMYQTLAEILSLDSQPCQAAGGWQTLSFLNYLFPPDIEAQAHNTAPLVTDGVRPNQKGARLFEL